MYEHAVSSGSASPASVSDALDIPLAAAEAELSFLQRLGLLAHGGYDSDLYRAVDPRASLSAVAAGLLERVSLIAGRIPSLAETYDRVARTSESSTATQILSGDADIVRSYVRIQHVATRELLVFDRPPYVLTPMEELEGAVLQRGVRWRGLYSRESFERPGSWDEVQRLLERGETARIVAGALPTKMVVADGRIAMVALTLQEGANEAILTEAQPLVAALRNLFESHWRRGIPLTATRPEASAPDHGRATERSGTLEERSILALMAAGLTDESIAGRLGISVRSLRRRLAVLQADLGAASRFQLGSEAARRGWI